MSVTIANTLDLFSVETGSSSLLNGLLAYWKLDEASGTLYDETVNNYDGTGTDLTYQQSTITNGVYSVSFNGTSSKLVMGSGGSGFPKPSSAGTVAMWINTSVAADTRLFYCAGGTAGGMVFYWNSADPSWMTGNGTTFQEDGFSGSTMYNDSAWHLFILSWDGSNKYAYADGTEKINVAWANSVSWTGPTDWTWGATNYGSGWWTGKMDGLGVWNRMITNGERATLYNSGAGRQYPFS